MVGAGGDVGVQLAVPRNRAALKEENIRECAFHRVGAISVSCVVVTIQTSFDAGTGGGAEVIFQSYVGSVL